jgi:hypothetical protein
MPLPFPDATVIGARDLARAATFYAALGAEPRRLPSLSAEAASTLYGLEGEAEQWSLTTPSAAHHRLILVGTPNEAVPFRPLLSGAYGLDYFSRDLPLSIELLEAAGGHGASPIVDYSAEPTLVADGEERYHNSEMRLLAPDDTSVFITPFGGSDSADYPTRLDGFPEALHSEMLQFCWVSSDVDRELDFWLKEGGLRLLGDGYPESRQMRRLMDHPRDTALRDLAITSQGPVVAKTKIEIMGYPDEVTSPKPDWPLRGGVFAPSFTVTDLDAVVRELPSATFSAPIEADRGAGVQRAISAVSPTALRFELWEVARS